MSELQWDALREVANVGAGHAARAVSKLAGGDRTGIDIPRAEVLDVDALVTLLGGPTQAICALSVEMQPPLGGRMLLVWPERDALALAHALLRSDAATLEDEPVTSALEEAANIMTSACLNAIGAMTHLTLTPGVPSLWRGWPPSIAAFALPGEETGVVMEVGIFSQTARGQLLLLPDATSVQHLLQALKV